MIENGRTYLVRRSRNQARELFDSGIRCLARHPFGRVLGRVSDAPLREGNRLALLKNGPDTYDDWLAAIGRAERWVHLDNYIFQNDEIGNRFADALSAKTAEGVSVRVLHDWFGCMDVPRSFWRGLRKAGVEVRAVNPPPRASRSARSGATTES